MKRTFLAFFVILVAILPAPAFAQLKVGIINLQKALLETADMKKASADLEARYKPKADQLAKLQKDLADIQTKLQNPQTAANVAADLQAEGARRQREAQRIQEDLQGDVERDRNEILQRGAVRMNEVVQKLAEAKGLDMVVDVTNAVYFKPAMEFSTEATVAYDKAYPAK